ncbi:hypothetical protein CYMTET_26842 [Cymbomonas tetramitiformis]|uniref:Cytochrome c-553 n=1 Tax=Cymbomonas tetramitiformis TaxID=36881 RepID=A0AAE0FQZ6_9CHLO|nr:hypothetical protein CYMTET_26842 [Cymbomonas tetramitiformis]
MPLLTEIPGVSVRCPTVASHASSQNRKSLGTKSLSTAFVWNSRKKTLSGYALRAKAMADTKSAGMQQQLNSLPFPDMQRCFSQSKNSATGVITTCVKDQGKGGNPALHAVAGKILLLAATASFWAPLPSAEAVTIAPEEDAAVVFQKSCAGCHSGGGNVVAPNKTLRQGGQPPSFVDAPNKTLRQGDLEANSVFDIQGLSSTISSGKGKMPGYGVECAPRGQCTFGPRLSDNTIESLSQYVLQQAAAGWPKEP